MSVGNYERTGSVASGCLTAGENVLLENRVVRRCGYGMHLVVNARDLTRPIQNHGGVSLLSLPCRLNGADDVTAVRFRPLRGRVGGRAGHGFGNLRPRLALNPGTGERLREAHHA